MLQKSTIVLLRIPFSFFLMPVFFFAMSQVADVDYTKALLVFIILHFIMYPASNGYNSYMDEDEESIGMLKKPPKPTRQLFYLTAVLDSMAILLSFLVSYIFAICIMANILASRAYSYRGIRLKKYPVTGFLTVIIFQELSLTLWFTPEQACMSIFIFPGWGCLSAVCSLADSIRSHKFISMSRITAMGYEQ